MLEQTAPTAIKRFARALEQAVHDEQHYRVKDARLVHFWDADSMFLAAFGFARLPKHNLNSDNMLAQSLLSAGLLGPVSMFPHHRVELFRNINEYAELIKSRNHGEAQELDAFLESHPKEVESFARIARLQPGDHGGAKQGMTAVQAVQEMTRTQFVLFEATSRTAVERLRRVLTNSDFVYYDPVAFPSTLQITRDPRFSMFVEGVERSRNTRTLSPQTASDAAALTTLSILNDRVSHDNEPVYPRFFTSSRSLIRLFEGESWVRGELSYRIRSGRHGTVWRDALYYVLRAMFPALASNVSRPDFAAQLERPTFEELRGLSDSLLQVLPRGDGELVRFAEQYWLPDGQQLITLIDSLQSAGMVSAWLQLDPPAYAKQWKAGFETIRSLSQSEPTVAALNDLYAETATEIRDELVESRFMLELRASLARMVRLLSSVEPGSIQWVDMIGANRWGVSSETIRSSPLSSEAPDPSYAALQQLSDIQRWTVDEVDAVACLLFALEAFPLVLALNDRLIEEVKSSKFRLVYAAAKVRHNSHLKRDEISDIVAKVRDAFEAAPMDEQLATCLGVGHVSFYAWFKSLGGRPPWTVSGQGDEFLEWSYDVVAARLSNLSDRDFVFGLNHLVYVASVGNLEKEHLGEMVAVLTDAAVTEGFYRLKDTLGYREFLVARRDSLHETDLAAWNAKYQERLRDSRRWLLEAQRESLDDLVVASHLTVLSAVLEGVLLDDEF